MVLSSDGEICVAMLVRLTKANRFKAAWLIALAYMLCVLAPGVSSAFAFCALPTTAAHLASDDHGHGDAPHAHMDGQHEHLRAAMHADHAHHQGEAKVVAAVDHAAPQHDHSGMSGASCCGVICMIAVPAPVMELAKPSAVTTACESPACRDFADTVPPQHYRPPIS